jgi:hypothetical protein
MRQPDTGSARHRPVVSVAEALRTRFPPEPGSRRRRPSVAEALRTRFPQPRTPGDDAPVPAAPWAAPACQPRLALPRRAQRGSAVPARPARPVSPDLLRRVLDGLQRL